jgi:uncharacterized phage protein gp47/JayE
MYESMTYEFILQRMLGRVREANSNLDTREGSIIYNAVAPAAVELVNAYIQLDFVLNSTFADTASREYLIRRAAERGLTPYPATHAILQGEFNIDIPIGARFSLANETINFVAISKISQGVFQMQCETAGRVGNDAIGQLIPIEYVEGLTMAQLTEVLTPGEDVEETEDFRKRYFDSLNSEAFGGNIADYRQKVNAIPGVGGVKVYPVWQGGGTVKLVIIDSEYDKPSGVLVNEVQTLVDPEQNHGKGLGIAPIGHVVTVVGADETTVNIEFDITLQNGTLWEQVEPSALETIENYLAELRRDWDSVEEIIVRVSQIETRLLNLPGIIDIGGTKLNGVAQNLIIATDNIPVKGQVTANGA